MFFPLNCKLVTAKAASNEVITVATVVNRDTNNVFPK